VPNDLIHNGHVQNRQHPILLNVNKKSGYWHQQRGLLRWKIF